MNLTEKIISAHLIQGEAKEGNEIALAIDQTLTQDATGTMAYLEFEAMGVPRVKTERSVAYIDHNTLQSGFENADDHKFIQSVAKKHGIYFSKPGNGICHQVHLERFGIPGHALCMDPGIGFGKSYQENLTLLRDTAHLRLPGYALLVGVSRKRVVGQATGVEKAADRMLGTVAANVAAIAGGCDIIRVHDVLECVESAKMADAIFRQSAKGEGPADG